MMSIRLLVLLLIGSCAWTMAAAEDAAPAETGGEAAEAAGEDASGAGGSGVPGLQNAAGGTRQPKVFVIQIHDENSQSGMIDWWQASYLKRKIDEAQVRGADYIVIDLHTNGGDMQAMLDMGQTLRDARRGAPPVPIIAFVRKAYSAGAFVALNCDWIFMASDAQMGSAQAVQLSPGGGMTPAPEKTLSPVRSAWRSAARMNPRREPNTALWLAMVDPDIVVYEIRWTENGRPVTTYATELELENKKEEWEQKPDYTVVGKLVEEGKLLTVGANQARQYGLVDRVVVDRQEMVSTMIPGDTTADVTVFKTSWGERLSRFMSGPIPTTILLLVAILALGAELFGASGIGATVFAFCIGLYFYCQFIAGSAGGLEILLFVAGIGLLGVEAFVVPGFGIAGFGGLGLMLLSLFMSAIPDGYWDIQFEYGGGGDGVGVVGNAALQVVIAIAAAILVLMVVSRYLEYVPLLGGLVLSGHVRSDVPEQPQAPVVGKEGVAITDLRPSGKAEIDGEVENVVAAGGYVEEGDRVRVIGLRLGRMVVEKVIVESDEA